MASTLNELLIEIQELVEKLEVIGFGDEGETVSHNGRDRGSVASAISDQFLSLKTMIQGRQSFATKADMDADLDHAENVIAEVWNDSVRDNNGIYGKLGKSSEGSWVKSSFDGYSSLLNRVQSLESPALDVSIFPRMGYVDLAGVLTVGVNYDFISTELLPVDNYDFNTVDLIGHPNVSSIAFYDSAGTYISGVSVDVYGDRVTEFGVIPTAAVYVTFTAELPGTIGVQRLQYTPSLSFLKISLPQLFSDLTGLKSNVVSENLFSYVILPGYIKINGEWSGDGYANWLCSDYIYVSELDQFAMDVIGNTAVSSIAYYDAEKFLLSSESVGSNDSPHDRFNKTLVLPSNTAYIRVSVGNPDTYAAAIGHTPIVTRTTSLVHRLSSVESEIAISTHRLSALEYDRSFVPFSRPRKQSLSPASKIMLYGTSISSDKYTGYKNAIESITGAQCYPGGFPGATAAQLASDAYLQRIFDYSANCIIVMIGGNDSGTAGSVGTLTGGVEGEPLVSETDISIDYSGTYFIQAVSHIIRKVNDQYYDIRTNAGLLGDETELEKEEKIDAVVKPSLVFCTPLAQKRYDDTSDFSKEASWMRKRDAVVECCHVYKTHCVDLLNLVPFDMSREPFWSSSTDSDTNSGIYFLDGLHPNKYGFEVIAEIVCADAGL